jgi:hypothetical protein
VTYIPHEELIRIDSMPFKERVLLMFKMFPGSQAYFEELYLSVQYGRKGIKVSYCAEDIYVIDVYVEGLGTLKKHWEEAELDESRIYRFSFCAGEDYGPGVHSGPFNKEKSDIFCERALSFMLSYGHNKRQVPLILHDFPEFAKFALEYVP